MLIRSDQALIRVEVEGVNIDQLAWSVFDGGDGTVDGEPVFPGGMAPQQAVGGVPKLSNITVERDWSDVLAALYKQLYSLQGAAAAKASYQPLGRNKVPVGEPFSYTGILDGVSRPGYKGGNSEGAMLKLIIQPNGEIA